MWFSDDELEKLRLENEDLLINEGGDVGRSAIWSSELEECYIQNSVNRVRFRYGCSRYYLFVSILHHSTKYYDSVVNRVSIPHLTREKLQEIKFVNPMSQEQTKIVEFLDAKTSLIDRLVAVKERRIELLKEKRTALINHAVTKGLNPNVKMKDSGIEWIGEIPEHWEIIRLKYIGNSLIGLTYQPDDIVDDSTQGILVLRSSNIQDGKLSLNDNVYVRVIPKKELIVKEGDILICSRNGSRALIGKNITISKDLEGNSFGAFMTVFRTKYYKIVSKILNSKVFETQSGLFLTSTINQLTQDNLNNLMIPFTYNESEQQQIVAYLDIETKKIDALVNLEQKKIDLLKEYRQALISEAVTGKIKVTEDQ